MNKGIDLGALQDALRNAELSMKSAYRTVEQAASKYASAQAVLDKARIRLKEADDARDAAKRAVVEGARQVAST
jgi:hypothetical protein